MPRRLFLFAICTTAHFVAAVSAFIWSYSVNSVAFDGKPMGWIGRHLAGPLANALSFPILPIIEKTALFGFYPTPLLQWLLIVGNSVVWGMAAGLIISYLATWNVHRRRT